ncbi:MAG TPA: fumarylacetoacetate hydrolase family protein [Polyangiales bacterium]|nr:fumarylacetoacetate hydrolase family protein [Polyangiales bacterium]
MVARAQIELCNVNGRSSLHVEGRILDVERRSHGSFNSDPMDALTRWEQFCTWAEFVQVDPGDSELDVTQLGPCVPRPQQVFAIGLNYRDHAREAELQEPKQPMVFTKFPSCLTGPRSNVPLTSDTVDWEVELVVVIGHVAHLVSEADALDYVAGYCIGQDISDRRTQFSDVPPQFSYGKSATGFGPVGPCVVAREAVDWSNVELVCSINGERMQNGKTAEMVFGVPTLIAFLSRYCTLLPGDLIFTGTPAGVGSAQKPRRYLKPGDVIHSKITGLGEMENLCQRSPVWADSQ